MTTNYWTAWAVAMISTYVLLTIAAIWIGKRNTTPLQPEGTTMQNKVLIKVACSACNTLTPQHQLRNGVCPDCVAKAAAK